MLCVLDTPTTGRKACVEDVVVNLACRGHHIGRKLMEYITVLIGANGVGKSNVVSFFQLLGYAMSGSLQNYIAVNGFADAFLYYGSKTTDRIKAKLFFPVNIATMNMSFSYHSLLATP